MSSPNDDDQNEVSRQSSTRRPRAPTITIDTSAVSPTRADDESEERAEATQGDATHDSENSQRSGPPVVGENSQSSELRPAPSFDSQSSRPTSPHNVSSPTSRNGQQHNFLSVPNPRSRGSSVDSGEPAQSPTSYGGDTYIPSPGSSQHTEARNVDTSQSSDHLLPDDEALKPDPGTEGDFERDNNPFAFTPGQVNKMLNPKSLGAFHALGGLQGLARGLKTSVGSGLSVDERNVSGKITFEEAVVSPPESKEEGPKEPGIKRRSTTIPLPKSEDVYLDRRRIFSDNRLPEKKAKSIWELAWLAYNDKVLILLSVAAVVSLALGIYQSVSAHNGETVQWVEGVAIIVAIVIVVVVGAANDWQKERQFVKLNRKKEDRLVKVVRSGKSREVNVHDIFTGDVMHLEPGDMIPVDGIFISGHNVTCDESSATGESDLLKKTPGDVAFRAIESHESLNKIDPFILSGAKVTEGVGTFLVTSTGVNSSHGKTMMSLQEESQTTPLQSKLNMLAEYIAKIGLTAGLLLFIATFIKFLVRLPKIEGGPNIKGQEFLAVFIVAVTIVVVSVPEGLPLAVTLALAFATTRMLKDNNLVRHLRACETMGNATTICSDKTGTLTQNKMSVVAGTIGTQARFGSTSSITDDAETSPGTPNEPKEVGLPSETSEVAIPQVIKTLSEDVKEVLKESIAINSTAFEGEVNGEESFIGSKTETALLTFARERLGMDSLRAEREAFEVVQQIPFDSGRKCMATAVKRSSGRYRIYVKGASELMVSRCAKIIQDPSQGITEAELNEDDIESLDRSIESFAGRSLRTIGILFKDYEQWPPRGIPTLKGDPTLADFDQGFKDLTFLAIVGIQDPLRDGVATAVQECQKAGVVVRMVTGDNLMTAKAIARDCGIFTPGGIVMEGPQFRKLSKTQMNQIIPRLQVLARSSPDDKRTLVKRLKDLGETVAVTGDGTNDAPALKTADVGFSMGIAGTEVAKEASAIILMDDNFASIVKAMMWGRAVNDAVKKFLQFQLTVNVTAVFLTFITAVTSEDEHSVLTAVQLLWVNLIMDTLAALALATDPPTRSILDRKPEPKSAPLISLTMWKMIIGQSIFQLAVTFIVYYAGPQIMNLPPTTGERNGDRRMQALIFNVFVWMQIFNQYNCRRLDNKFNFFEGITKNYFFMIIQVIIIAGQVMIIFVGDIAFSVTRIDGVSWAVSIVLGLLSIPVGLVIRCIPDEWIRKCIPAYFKRKKTPALVVTDEEQQWQWNPGMEEIREELAFLKRLRGGRLNTLKHKLKNPREMLPRSRSGSRTSSMPQTPNNEPSDQSGNPGAPPTPDSRRSMQRRRARSHSNSAFGPAAAMAGIVAGSIGGWSPIERRDGDSFARFPLQDRSDLEGHPGVEIHPDTKPDDPVLSDPEDFKGRPPSQSPEMNPAFRGPPKSPKAGGSSKEKEN